MRMDDSSRGDKASDVEHLDMNHSSAGECRLHGKRYYSQQLDAIFIAAPLGVLQPLPSGCDAFFCVEVSPRMIYKTLALTLSNPIPAIVRSWRFCRPLQSYGPPSDIRPVAVRGQCSWARRSSLVTAPIVNRSATARFRGI